MSEIQINFLNHIFLLLLLLLSLLILLLLLLSGLQIIVCIEKLFFLFLNQNICFGYSKEPSQ